MRKGFVFGKFYPFHLGHKALIEFALKHCQELYVVVCCSDMETLCSENVRSEWIQSEFDEEPRVKVLCFPYTESELPNTSIPSREVSKSWALRFKQLLPDVQGVFTSETYGEYVAEYMQISHFTFDLSRQSINISASQIRSKLIENWNYLTPAVQRYLGKSVVLLGTESTGKTTLAKTLAQHFNGGFVEEIGREIIPDSASFSLNQLHEIAVLHANNIDQAKSDLLPLVVVDTDIYLTQSYARFAFNQELELDQAIYDKNAVDLRLYLTNEVPYIQDGTRMGKARRDQLDESHRATLKEFGIAYQIVEGSWQEREKKVITLVSKLLSERTW